MQPRLDIDACRRRQRVQCRRRQHRFAGAATEVEEDAPPSCPALTPPLIGPVPGPLPPPCHPTHAAPPPEAPAVAAHATPRPSASGGAPRRARGRRCARPPLPRWCITQAVCPAAPGRRAAPPPRLRPIARAHRTRRAAIGARRALATRAAPRTQRTRLVGGGVRARGIVEDADAVHEELVAREGAHVRVVEDLRARQRDRGRRGRRGARTH